MKRTLVCVKTVKQEAAEDWDENMPLPGDIVEGFSQDHDGDESFVPATASSEFSSQLGKIRLQADNIWLKVRRGNSTLKLHALIVPVKSSLLRKTFTIKAVNDDRHVAVLRNLTLEECTQLQEMSRRVMNVDGQTFSRTGVKYAWKMKVDTYLPDARSTVVGSILFMPLQGECCLQSTTARCMAWFSAAVSTGVPLVFVNIQTEQCMTSKKTQYKQLRLTGKENNSKTPQIVKAIRLWFLPGVAEVPIEMTPKRGETRFGMDIKQTDEGFVCVSSVAKDLAADRAGLGQLHQEANNRGHLLVISRLEGKSLMPSRVCSAGLIYCCNHDGIRGTMASAIGQLDSLQVHLMAWPNQSQSPPANSTTKATIGLVPFLVPPKEF